MNSLAKQHSRIGALEFAIYYIKALDWSLATTDASLLKAISGPSCTACKANIDALVKLKSQHAYLSSGRIHIRSSLLVIGKGSVTADYTIKFELVQDPIVAVYPTATSTETAQSHSFISYVYVSWLSGAWRIIERTGQS